MFLSLAATVLALTLTSVQMAPPPQTHKDLLDLPLEKRESVIENVPTLDSPPEVKIAELVKKKIEAPVKSSDLENWYERYGNEYSVDNNILRKIAQCEAGQNQNAKNGDYAGMFQFASQTWSSTRAAMGLDQNTELRFNAEESIKTAAFKISRGGAGAWPNCSR